MTLQAESRPLACMPRFFTPRDYSRQTLGPAVGETARLLCKPFMPWQQFVADVAMEVDSDTGRLVYSEVGLTVPRQSGKSTWVLAKSTHRASASKFFGTRQRLVYTAQTRQKAREKWEEDYVAELEASRAFRARVSVSKGNGNEHIRYTNGSRFGIEANTEKAGHGGTLDEAYIDEAFAQVDKRLEQAFRPAMITRKNTQLIWVSTAGWLDASPYLEAKVNRGRAQSDEGAETRLAYFEWSAPEDVTDYADRDVWRACMPALGYTIDEDDIAAELDAMKDDINGFRRAYLNQWVPKEVPLDGAIDEATWAALLDADSACGDSLAIAIDMPPDRSHTVIYCCGVRPDGLLHIEVLDDQPGSGWVAERLDELDTRWRQCALVIDPNSPAGSLIEEVKEKGLDVTTPTTQEVGAASAMMLDAVRHRNLRHRVDAALAEGATGATKRPIGDGAFAWNRKNFSTDISPFVAAGLAVWGWTTKHHESRGGWAVGF